MFSWKNPNTEYNNPIHSGLSFSVELKKGNFLQRVRFFKKNKTKQNNNNNKTKKLYLTQFSTKIWVFVFPGPRLWSPAPICIYQPRPLICICQTWLTGLGNNKSQSLDVLLFLFLLPNPFVKVIVDRNETKVNLRKY